jgi:hypothetical protein
MFNSSAHRRQRSVTGGIPMAETTHGPAI